MKIPQAVRQGLAISLLLLLAGCAGFGRQLETPRVNLADIRMQRPTGLETIFEVSLRVLNPNDVDLVVKGVDCELEVNGEPFATGLSAAEVRIPAYGAEIVPVTAYSSVIKIFRSVIGLHKTTTLAYRLKGRLRLGGDAILPPVLPFDSTGKFDFSELARTP
jgi:LEA14-like dessication related protein